MSDPLIEAAARVIWQAHPDGDDSTHRAHTIAKALNAAGLLAYQDRLSKARARRTLAQADRDHLARLLQLRTEALSRVVAENEQLRAAALNPSEPVCDCTMADPCRPEHVLTEEPNP